jgi:hypothetical protein
MNGGPGLLHSEISRRGGKSKSETKLRAARANLARAQAARAAKRAALGKQ